MRRRRFDRGIAPVALLACLMIVGDVKAQTSPLPRPLDGRPRLTPPPAVTGPEPEPPTSAPTEPLSLPDVTSGIPPSLPINLPTALQLAGVRPLDIAAATAQVEQAMAILLQAKALKVPNLNGGVGYYRHDGTNQNLFTGQTFQKGTNGLQVGGGPTISVAVTDAIFAPLAAKRVVGARRADLQTARNNSLGAVALAYFDLQEARGRLVGADASIVRSRRLVVFAERLAPSLIAPLEINRARAEQQNLEQARELAIRDWRQASARLAEILLLEPTTLLEPIEPPFLQMCLVPPDLNVEELVPVALGNRPEIASNRELLEAANQTLRREKARPFLPNIIATTPGTANAGVLPAGQFFSGANGNLNGQGSRADFTVTAYWQLQNGGLANVGLIRQRRAEQQLANVELNRTLFRVRSDVSQALARLQTSRNRVPQAEEELRQAIESADKNFLGLRETTRPAGELLNLVVRPQEVVAAIQELNVAYQNYSGSVNDFNRSQFDLYRALGQPAQWVTTLKRQVVPMVSPTMDSSAPAPPPPDLSAPRASNGPPTPAPAEGRRPAAVARTVRNP